MEMVKTRRIFLVIVSLLEVILFGGLHYGWISLLFVLMDEGLFLDLCHGNSTLKDNITETNKTIDFYVINSCVERDERFNLIFALILASVTALSVLFGYLHFKIGIKLSRILSKTVFIGGALLIGFSSRDLPWLVLPGLIMIGSAGLSLMVSNMQITQVLKGGASIYVGVMNGCYDASSVMQLVVKVLYQQSIPKLYSYLGISVVFVIITSVCTFLHPSPPKLEFEMEVEQKNDSSRSWKKNETKSNDKPPPMCSILRSRPFFMHLLWASCLLLRFSFFLGAIYPRIESTAGSDNVSYFTNILGYVMFGGFLSSFLAGHFSEIQKLCFSQSLQKVLPLAVTSLFAIAVSGLSFINDPNALYASFVCFTFLRSFLFCMMMDYIIFTFPKEYMTVLYSTTVTFAGTVSLLQYALFSWRNKYPGALTHVNILCLCVSVVSLAHPLFISICGRQNESSKGDEQKDQNVYSVVTTSNQEKKQNGHTIHNGVITDYQTSEEIFGGPKTNPVFFDDYFEPQNLEYYTKL